MPDTVYLAFSGDEYYPEAYGGDLIGVFETLAQARTAARDHADLYREDAKPDWQCLVAMNGTRRVYEEQRRHRPATPAHYDMWIPQVTPQQLIDQALRDGTDA